MDAHSNHLRKKKLYGRKRTVRTVRKQLVADKPHSKKSECVLIHRGSFTGPLSPIFLEGYCLNWVHYSRLLGVDGPRMSVNLKGTLRTN